MQVPSANWKTAIGAVQSRIFDPPHKFVWRQYGPEALYDLSWDPSEKSDQIERRKDLADSMKDEVLALIDAKRLDKLRRFSSEDRPLGERAAEAFLAGREAMLADQTVATDIVWFAQEILKDRPDPMLGAWVEHQIPLQEEDMYYPILDPTRLSPIEIPEELPGGLMKFAIYLLAAVGGPESRALPIFEEYLALENATGYVLTHQLSGLEWARAMGRPFPDSTYARSPRIHRSNRDRARLGPPLPRSLGRARRVPYPIRRSE